MGVLFEYVDFLFACARRLQCAVICLALVPVAGLANPLPVEDGAVRRELPSYRGGSVFAAGETVEGHFICDQSLTLLALDRRTPEPYHSAPERFIVFGHGPLADKMEAIPNHVVPVTLRITGESRATGSDGTTRFLANTARLISVGDPVTELNPTPKEVVDMRPGQPVVLKGRVVVVADSHLVLEAGKGKRYMVSGTSNVFRFPSLERNLAPEIEALPWNATRIQLGDTIQLTAFKEATGVTSNEEAFAGFDNNGEFNEGAVFRPDEVTMRGGLVATHFSQPGLVSAGPERWQKYSEARNRISEALDGMRAAVARGDFQEARRLNARLFKEYLLASESAAREQVFERQAPKDQPVWFSHGDVSHLNTMYGVEIDTMTRAEYVEFARAWAKNVLPLKTRREIPAYQGYSALPVLGLLEEVGVPPAQLRLAAQDAVLTRLQHLERVAEDDPLGPPSKPFLLGESQEAGVALSDAIHILGTVLTPESLEFLTEIGGRFLKYRVASGNHLANRTHYFYSVCTAIQNIIDKNKPAVANVFPHVLPKWKSWQRAIDSDDDGDDAASIWALEQAISRAEGRQPRPEMDKVGF